VKKITDEIKDARILICDGGWGTQLFEMGLKSGECPELWNATNRDKVLEIARSYVDAGADIIETNSFGGSSINLSRHGIKERAYELNKFAAEISREAAQDRVHVAGSIGPCGKMLITGDVSEEELYESFAEQAEALEDGGADAAIIETMIDALEASVAVRAVKENTKLEIIASATCNKTPSGEFRTMMGSSIREMAEVTLNEGAEIIGTNCGNGTDLMVEIVAAIKYLFPSIPIIVQSNAGLPFMDDLGNIRYPETAEYMASRIPALINAGANIIGGCCGTTPEYIEAFKQAVQIR
jgi:5-methyltetrahydrofolate--homocysteine methyltransferase